MKTNKLLRTWAALLSVAFTTQMHAQSTAFTYQGRLTDNGSPAGGSYDLKFTIYDSSAGSTVFGGPLTNSPTAISNGLFTVTLDFGSGVFDGGARWLEIAAVTNGGGAFITLVPRQPITSTPYAIKAANAMTVDMGTISDPSFIGTTGNSPLDLFVNNQRGLRLQYPSLGTIPNLIAGYTGNRIGTGSEGAVVLGGGTIGATNAIGTGSAFSFIGSGFDNQIANSSFAANIVGGQYITIGSDSDWSAIGGGVGNGIADNAFAGTIAGGSSINIGNNSDYSSIGGGAGNSIGNNSPNATIPGGEANAVGTNAAYAFAAGRRAKANHAGAFVWADSQNADFASTTNNQFLIRAAGGVAIGTNDPAGAMLRVAGSIQAESFLGMGTTLMLGTTDNQPLEFKVNNQRVLRFEYPSGASAPNLIGGASGNSVGSGTEGAVIAGGGGGDDRNLIGDNSDYSAIGGGFNNTIAASAFAATITGGRNNDIGVASDWSAIGGGNNNTIAASALAATIAGGTLNGIGVDSGFSAIGGGRDNNIGEKSTYSVISGGYDNNIASNSYYATIAGGWGNDIGVNSDWSAIGGGQINTIASNSLAATIAAGAFNDIGVNSIYSAIGGGNNNTIAANSAFATIAGGVNNDIGVNSGNSTIGGGSGNTIAANSAYATIAGGVNNDIGVNSDYSAIGGGWNNDIAANAFYAVIPGGSDNEVGTNANYAFAAGRRAKANHPGTFVWADSQNADFGSTSSNQFLIRASGGVGIGTTNPGATVTISRPVQAAAHQLELRNEGSIQSPNFDGIRFTQDADGGTELASITVKYFNTGMPDLSFSVRGKADALFIHGDHNGRGGYVGIGTTTPTNKLDVVGNVSATSFITTSDRNAKENFKPVSPQQILAKVVALPISRWNFKTDTDTPHVGPMAQDFHAAFGVGPDDKHIATVDADGVALAAIQGLNEKVESGKRKAETRMQILEAENAELKQTVSELKQLVGSLANKLNGGAR